MKARLLLLAVACYTSQNVLDAQCHVACRYKGYDSGKHHKESCYCLTEIPTKELFRKTLTIHGVKRIDTETPEVMIPEAKPWYE